MPACAVIRFGSVDRGLLIVGLFRSKPRPGATCPLCNEEMVKGSSLAHWEKSHVQEIGPGQGVASGQFTWTCTCGPAGMKWERETAAAAGLAMHMQEKHGIQMLS